MLQANPQNLLSDGFHQLPQTEQSALLVEQNGHLDKLTAEDRVFWALENLPGVQALSSSFGIQSAVMLHMVTKASPGLPVLLMDTGYLFPETYQFIDMLTNKLDLNLKVYRADMSSAWQEARFGQLWEKGEDGLKRYNTINKVEPMQKALVENDISSWFSGLRRTQSQSRAARKVLEVQDGRFKLLPIIDWSNQRVHQYLTEHDLPYHPLWYEGYVSVGDVHTSRKLEAGMSEEDTRFFGVMRECGLHI